jgi:L-arabinose isomerase
MWSPRWSTDPSRSVDGSGVLPWVEPRKTRVVGPL